MLKSLTASTIIGDPNGAIDRSLFIDRWIELWSYFSSMKHFVVFCAKYAFHTMVRYFSIDCMPLFVFYTLPKFFLFIFSLN